MNALGQPGFRPFLFANTLSFLGSWIERLSLSWLAWELSGSAFWTGLVAAAFFLPSALLGPIVGAIAERWDMRRAAIWTNGMMTAFSFALFIIVMWLRPPVAVLAVMALVIGVVVAVNNPVRLVIVSQLVDKAAFSSAVRWNATAYNVTRVLGPAIAGVLIATIGARWSLLANPFSYLPLLAALAFIPFRPREARAASVGSQMGAIKDGMRYILRDGAILWCMGLTAINALAVRSILEIMPVVVGELLKGDVILLGVLGSASGAGSLLGATFSSMLRISDRNSARLAAVFTVPGGLTLALLGAGWLPDFTIFLVAAAAFCATICAINCQALVFTLAPSDYHARTMTWWTTLSLGASSLGGVIISAAVEFVPMDLIVIVSGLVGAIGAVIIYQRTPVQRIDAPGSAKQPAP